jgi:putative NADPH-quinone reductase
MGLLKAKLALVFNTSDTLPEREAEAFGDPLATLWKNCIFGFCGVREFHRKTFSVVVTSTQDRRRQWLREVEETVGNLFPRPMQ